MCLALCLPEVPFKVDMTRFIQERLRPISAQRVRCLDRSSEATEEEVKAPRDVAGSLSWVARQCRPDEVGTASTLQGSVSRDVVKDLSDANRAVNQLKQTEDVGLLIHAIPLVNLRTVSISDAALDLDRPDGSTHVGASPARISSHVAHVLLVAQGEKTTPHKTVFAV